MKLAVIVARFQNSMPTIGHIMLINHCKAHADKVLIVIGYNHTKLTFNNPLSKNIREKMLRQLFQDPKRENQILISELADCKYNDYWSLRLDELINEFSANRDVTLYGGRDCFLNVYSGKYKQEIVDFNLNHISSTEDRKEIHSRILNTKDWREGIIFSSADRYPVSYQTVDVAILKKCPVNVTPGAYIQPPANYHRIEILLGRKPGCPKFQFIGGFVDVTDDSLELAAKRELSEEVGLIETSKCKYIGSARIDDWRYRKEKDKIMSVLYTCEFMFGTPVASDDIEQVEWFDLENLTVNQIEPEHGVLLNMLKENLCQK